MDRQAWIAITLCIIGLIAWQVYMVKQLEGTVKSDQAQVENARLQLEFTRITAPFPGRGPRSASGPGPARTGG